MQAAPVRSDQSGKGHNRPSLRPRLPGTRDISTCVPHARIGRPSPSAMTSSPRKGAWIVEFDPISAPAVEPLMGWTASDDPFAPIRLRFPSLASAIDFVERQGWDCTVLEPAAERLRPHPGRDRVYRSRVASSAMRRPRIA